MGVISDEHLHLNTHIKQIIHKANNVLGTIKQTFNTRDAAVIRLLHWYDQFYTTLLPYGIHIKWGISVRWRIIKEELLN